MTEYFDFNQGLNWLCDNYNFKYCRLHDNIENFRCFYYSIRISKEKDWAILDIIFLVVSFIVAVIVFALIPLFKNFGLYFKKQSATRGALEWRLHFFFYGLFILFWCVSYSLVTLDGPLQQYALLCRGFFLDVSEGCLFFATLIDLHVFSSTNPILDPDEIAHKEKLYIQKYKKKHHGREPDDPPPPPAPPAKFKCYVRFLGFIIILALSAPIFLAKKSAAITLFYCLFIPIFTSFFHFLTMIPVCAVRGMCSGAVILVFMFIFHLCPIVIDLFFNPLLCDLSKGWFSASTLAVITCLIYRVFAQSFYTLLKRNEKTDNLTTHKKLFDTSSSELNKPHTILVDDYSYDYTYTDSSANEDPERNVNDTVF